MEALPSMTESLLKPDFRKFVKENVKDTYPILISFEVNVMALRSFMKSRKFRVLPGEEKQAMIGRVQEMDRTVGQFMSGLSLCPGNPELVGLWRRCITLMVHAMKATNMSYLCGRGLMLMFNNEVVGGLDRYMSKINIENMLLEAADSSNCIILNKWDSQALFFKKAFPALGEFREYNEIKNFYDESFNELDSLPTDICDACERESLALLLIGGLLSFKPIAYDIWVKVKENLVQIKEFYRATSNHMWYIIAYCYDDLPNSLQQCFLYLACYPIGYEIPTTSLIEIWTAEEFITPEEGETTEETANKYLEQLIQRSLVCVKRSIFGTIKSCRVHPLIHEFTIIQSKMNRVLVVDPFPEEIKSLFRIAIHSDNKKQYTEVEINLIRSFLAFDSDRSFLGSAISLLKVLELRKSTIPVTDLSNMVNLRYLGLRGSTISELPPNIGDMKYLQTLDARDTSIEILPESLWNISKLRRVYVKPSPQIKGPPSTGNISDLQVLKTVGVHKSWEKNIPQFVSQLRKLAISNPDNIDWRAISNLCSHMDKLISMEIMSKIIPSESVDLRAFPNLEKVMSIKLDGKWICRKLFIDNVKFPPNLTKLTLTNSGLKEDPMPTLGKLQVLKFLRLQDGAYTGKQMVCSAEGFPELQFLKLKKLENLDKWEVDKESCQKLQTVRVVQCCKLTNYPSRLRGTITDKDD